MSKSSAHCHATTEDVNNIETPAICIQCSAPSLFFPEVGMLIHAARGSSGKNAVNPRYSQSVPKTSVVYPIPASFLMTSAWQALHILYPLARPKPLKKHSVDLLSPPR